LHLSSLPQVTNYLWYGEVVPRDGTSGLEYRGRFSSKLGLELVEISGSVQIVQSDCKIRVTSNVDVAPQLLANNVRSTVAGILDAIGYVDGSGFTFVLHGGRNVDTGTDYSWPGSVRELAQESSDRSQVLNDIIAVFGVTPLLGDALGDYRRAILEPWDSSFYAYRCLETIQRYWQGEARRSSKASWEAMRIALELEKADLVAVKDSADYQRHGGRQSVSDREHLAALGVANNAIMKFVKLLGREIAGKAHGTT